MEFPVIELVDRYAIAVVKQAKTNGENREEVKFYVGQLINAGIEERDRESQQYQYQRQITDRLASEMVGAFRERTASVLAETE